MYHANWGLFKVYCRMIQWRWIWRGSTICLFILISDKNNAKLSPNWYTEKLLNLWTIIFFKNSLNSFREPLNHYSSYLRPWLYVIAIYDGNFIRLEKLHTTHSRWERMKFVYWIARDRNGMSFCTVHWR